MCVCVCLLTDVGPPRNFEGEVRSANSIQLTWTEPLSQSGGGSIESYELYYNDTHFRQNVRVTISPTYTTYLLSDLTPATVYHLRLAARTSRGEGPSTDTIQLQTLDYGQPHAYLLTYLFTDLLIRHSITIVKQHYVYCTFLYSTSI